MWSEISVDVEKLFSDCREKYHNHLDGLDIGLVFRDEGPENDVGVQFCGVKKVAGEIKNFVDLDFVIWFAEDVWARSSLSQKKAMVDHALCCCGRNNNFEPKVNKPDVVEFSQVLERHGFWSPKLKMAEQVARQYQLPGLEKTGRTERMDVNVVGQLGLA